LSNEYVLLTWPSLANELIGRPNAADDIDIDDAANGDVSTVMLDEMAPVVVVIMGVRC
jgi:hypothetical protein